MQSDSEATQNPPTEHLMGEPAGQFVTGSGQVMLLVAHTPLGQRCGSSVEHSNGHSQSVREVTHDPEPQRKPFLLRQVRLSGNWINVCSKSPIKPGARERGTLYCKPAVAPSFKHSAGVETHSLSLHLTGLSPKSQRLSPADVKSVQSPQLAAQTEDVHLYGFSFVHGTRAGQSSASPRQVPSPHSTILIGQVIGVLHPE